MECSRVFLLDIEPMRLGASEIGGGSLTESFVGSGKLLREILPFL
jgi:hypothetical protein